MSAHTPGPWVARGNVVDTPGGHYAIRCDRSGETPEIDRDNARLIAAAPALYEALREAEQALNGIRCTCRCTPWEQVGPAVIRARAALAAAKGAQT